MIKKALPILINFLQKILGILLAVLMFLILLSIISYNYSDPSFNSKVANSVAVKNWVGSFGAYIADLLLQSLGFASVLLILIGGKISQNMLKGKDYYYVIYRIIAAPPLILSFCLILALLPYPESWYFNGFGGYSGILLLNHLNSMPLYQVLIFANILSMALFAFIFEINFNDFYYFIRYSKLSIALLSRLFYQFLVKIFYRLFSKKMASHISDVKKQERSLKLNSINLNLIDSESQESGSCTANEDLAKNQVSSLFSSCKEGVDENFSIFKKALNSSSQEGFVTDDNKYSPNFTKEGKGSTENKEDDFFENLKIQDNSGRKPIVRAENYKSRKATGKYQLPEINLLIDRSAENLNKKVSPELIEEQSRILMRVLEDFGVKGKILGAKIGPIVTLYEFEPVAGTKAARIIGLSDDIARSMSAISARISVIPGQTAIGIELPNPKRQMIFLRELIEAKEYRLANLSLPMILGKDIAGSIMVADLAKMPHLLIAGTTGSGKSVGLNVMILSILFQMKPSDCKFIMIDPKMLELSIYDGIPHLLAPVVTEPGKAVIALKWVVAEMEERYRLMASFAVRNIAGYNEKAEKAQLAGEKLTKRVQTGYDPTNGQPIIEEIEFEPKKLPFIVVIVDEMADLMLVAGKEIEGSVQRLAQMARAAGIHLIMATQRPSVDVITGVIKANFPTRISFQVTSRIDSRTILGTQGAEQLLGQGDMIYLSGGSKMQRVHGPFCSDMEIEKIVKFIKNQDLSEFDDQNNISFDNIASEQANNAKYNDDGNSCLGAEGSEGDLYQKAIAIVRRDKKTSISYVQRQLRIGYNKAANLIEQMERGGILSSPNISGKRDLLEEDQ